MISRQILTFLLVSLPFVQSIGQTTSDLKKRYGPPREAYEVRRGVLVTARYTNSGQTCEMVIERTRKTAGGFELDTNLSDELVEQLIEELLPISERGKRGALYGWSVNLGQSIQTNYSHEKIEITAAGTRQTKNMVVFIRWKDRQCREDSSLE